jgi:ketosteroid isomerase-like protein
MRRSILVIANAVILILTAGLARTEPVDPATSPFAAAGKQYVEGFNRKDAAAVAALFAEDAVRVNTQGIIRGREAIQKSTQAGLDAGSHTLTLRYHVAHIDGNTGWSVAEYDYRLRGNDGSDAPVRGFATSVWVRDGEGWKIKGQTTVNAPPPKWSGSDSVWNGGKKGLPHDLRWSWLWAWSTPRHLNSASPDSRVWLIIEGSVEANLQNWRHMAIAETGVFNGNAAIDDVEVSGRFEGDLVVRKRLLIRASGHVSGTITYGEIEIEAGGRISGMIQAPQEPAIPSALREPLLHGTPNGARRRASRRARLDTARIRARKALQKPHGDEAAIKW